VAVKNVLIAVVGLSPQVITETLFALHQQQKSVRAIHIITTRQGKEKINAHLLSPTDGKYYQYLKEYGIDPATIDFGFHNIHTIKDTNGMEIDDIEGEEENESLLKTCMELTFSLTRDPDTAVFFSIAGGRKTMSACLTLAAQMYARPQDRLYHVLVSPEFEENRDFYYPPREPRLIELRDKNAQPVFKETKYAHVNLIHVPFVSIRSQLRDDLLDSPKDPGTLMLSLIKEEDRRLTLDLISRKVTYKNLELDLMPARMALYAFFALQKKGCTKKEVETCGTCTECFLNIQEVFNRQKEVTELYRKVRGTRPLDEMSGTGIIHLNAENFNMYKGKIKKDLLGRFGPYVLRELEIASIGTRPDTRYGIRMDKSRIEIVY